MSGDKPIDRLWRVYRDMVISKEMPEFVRIHGKLAFFGGVIAVLDFIAADIGETKEERDRVTELMFDELEQFKLDVVNGKPGE